MHKSTLIMLIGSSAIAGSILTYIAMTMRPSYIASGIKSGVAKVSNSDGWSLRDLAFWKRERVSSGGAANPVALYQPTYVNAAFEEYRAETLTRLESEARSFHDYLERLRFSRDREAFDAYLKARSSHPSTDVVG